MQNIIEQYKKGYYPLEVAPADTVANMYKVVEQTSALQLYYQQTPCESNITIRGDGIKYAVAPD